MRLTEADLTEPRIRCPRCGESFPNRHYTGIASYAGAASSQPSSTQPPAAAGSDMLRPVQPRRMSNTDIARFIVAIMIGMGALGLTFALLTVNFRRENDFKKSAPTETALSILGYLPADSQIVLTWNLAALRAKPDGEKLLEKLKTAKVDLGLRQIQSWTGLAPDEIEHLALGIRFGEELPRFTLVVQTQKPYQQDQIAEALAPAKPVTFRGSSVYQVQLGPVGESLVWLRNNRTIVVEINLLSAKLDDLKALPKKPHRGVEIFPEAVQRAALEQAELRGTFLWGGGNLEGIKPLKQLLKAAAKNGKTKGAWFDDIKTFQFAVRLQENLIVNAALQANDKAAAIRLQHYLEKHKPKAVESFSIVGPESKKAGALPASAKNSVTMQMRFSTQQLLQWIEQLEAIAPMKRGR